MVISIDLSLYKKEKLMLKKENLKAIKKKEELTFLSEDVKTTLSFSPKMTFKRENSEFIFTLELQPKENATYYLKSISKTFDIKVDHASYKYIDNIHIIEYNIETEEGPLRVEILEKEEQI